MYTSKDIMHVDNECASRMFRPPGVQRLLWSSWLWVPLSLVTVFDTSGNAATRTHGNQKL